MGVLTSLVESTPVVGQTMGFVKTASKVYKATTPTAAATAAVEGIIIDCSPPVIKYPIKCTILVAQLCLAIGSASNPITGPMTASLVIGQATSILEERLL